MMIGQLGWEKIDLIGLFIGLATMLLNTKEIKQSTTYLLLLQQNLSALHN